MQQSGALPDKLNYTSRDAGMQHAHDLVAKAAEIEPFFKDFVRTIANKLHIHGDAIKFADIKAPGCIVNKALYEKDGDITQVKDILRATIEVNRIDQIGKAENLLSLMDKGALRCLTDIKVDKKSIKNTFNDASFDGFKMLKANFSIQGFSAAEIQMGLPCDAKEMEKSHAAYAVKRACEHAFSKFEYWPDRLTAEEQAQLALHLDRIGRRAGKQRERHNLLAHGLQ